VNFKEIYFNVWQDIWNFHKKYALVDLNDDQTWKVLTEEADKLHEKYARQAQGDFANGLLLAVVAEIDKKARHNIERVKGGAEDAKKNKAENLEEKA
jgi:hypothetical protein